MERINTVVFVFTVSPKRRLYVAALPVLKPNNSAFAPVF